MTAADTLSFCSDHAAESLDVTPPAALRFVKVVHTLAWAFLAGCIVAIPLFGWLRRFDGVLIAAAIVVVEIIVLAANRWRCPLTNVAARYTDDRRDNFDIYLPLWIARNNKPIFGWLYVAVLLFSLALWMQWL